MWWNYPGAPQLNYIKLYINTLFKLSKYHAPDILRIMAENQLQYSQLDIGGSVLNSLIKRAVVNNPHITWRGLTKGAFEMRADWDATAEWVGSTAEQ